MKTINATRQFCQICGSLIRIDYHVPNEIWKEAIHPHYQNGIVCLDCFMERADEKMLPWDKNIKFFPESKNTHLARTYKSEALIRKVTTMPDKDNIPPSPPSPRKNVEGICGNCLYFTKNQIGRSERIPDNWPGNCMLNPDPVKRKEKDKACRHFKPSG